MSDRAPDGQPTENIRLVLTNVRTELETWKQYRAAEHRALKRSERMISTLEQTVRRWERYLAIRLSEEPTTTEVTGL